MNWFFSSIASAIQLRLDGAWDWDGTISPSAAPSQICSFTILLLRKSAPSQIAHREIGMRSQLRAPPVVRENLDSSSQIANVQIIQAPSDHAMTFVYPRSPDREAVAAEHGDML